MSEEPGFNEEQDTAVRSEHLDAFRPDDSNVVQQQDARGIVPTPGFLEIV